MYTPNTERTPAIEAELDEAIAKLVAEGCSPDHAREIAAINLGLSWGDVICIGPDGKQVPPEWVTVAEAARRAQAEASEGDR